MDRRTTAQIDLGNPEELRRCENRLSKRLLRFGYRLSKGEIQNATRKIQLKRIPRQRGYQLLDISTGQIVLGRGHRLTLEEVESFWREKHLVLLEEKRRERAEHRKAAVRKAGKRFPKWW